MSSENAIHIKLDYIEALKARRSILSLELSSLKIAKRIEGYRDLRMEELGLKSKLNGKMKETKSNIKNLQSFLPSAKVPKILKRDLMGERPPERMIKRVSGDDIESQLREIERRLGELQKENV